MANNAVHRVSHGMHHEAGVLESSLVEAAQAEPLTDGGQRMLHVLHHGEHAPQAHRCVDVKEHVDRTVGHPHDLRRAEVVEEVGHESK